MAIEKTPSKNWELTLYEMQRTPQPLITDDSEIAICPLRLSNELKCPICLDFLNNTMATKECLHRFCAQCIVTALRSGNKECPACRKKLVSKRSLRHDHNFDAIIAKLFPYRKEYEAHQANVMAKQIRNSMRSSISTTKGGSNQKNEKSVNQQNIDNFNSTEIDSRSINEQTEASLHEDDSKVSDSSESIQPLKRMRQSSSESGEPETNGSSSITSELCSLLGSNVQNRDGNYQTINATKDNSCTNTLVDDTNLSQHNQFDMDNDSDINDGIVLDILLEPLDGRCGKNRLNELFVLQLPEKASVGHLIEFLSLKRTEYNASKRRSSDLEPYVKMMKLNRNVPEDYITFNIYLAMTGISERKIPHVKDNSTKSESISRSSSINEINNGSTTTTSATTNNNYPINLPGSSSGNNNNSINTTTTVTSKITKKSLNKRLDSVEILKNCLRLCNKSRREKKSSKVNGKHSNVDDCDNMVDCFVFYYQETILNNNIGCNNNDKLSSAFDT